MSDYIKTQIEERARAWEEAKALLDGAAAEKRELTAEESEKFTRINDDLDRRAQVVKDFMAAEAREAEIRAAVAGRPEARPTEDRKVDTTDADQIRALARGEIRSFEFRDVVKSATGAPVPTSFYGQVIEKARYTGPMLETSTILNTASGENLQIPRTNAYSTAGLEAEAATIDESDPTFSAFVTLGAYKYAFLTQVSLEMLEDAGVDILGYLSTNVGQALGYSVNSVLTTGDGSSKPLGIVPAATVGVTGATGVAGAFSYDNLVDLVYSTDAAVRRMPGFGIMGGSSSMANLRKLQDGAGFYVWQPSLQLGQPDRVLGYNVYENPHVAAVATGAKSLIAGDLKSYMVRQVGGIRLDRSDDFAFADGLVTFRAIMRVDGNLPQSSHVKAFIGGAS